MSEEKRLTRKQRVFVDEYLKCWSAAEAARRAGYSVKTAYSIGPRLLRNVEVAEAIKARLAEIHMGTDEALAILAEHARGDMGDLMAISSMGFSLDLEAARASGKTKLIKEIEQKVVTINGKNEDKEIITTRLKLHDPQAAIEKILRAAKVLKDPQGTEIVFRYADGNIAATVTPKTETDQGGA
jgi:phage terminase small subunit